MKSRRISVRFADFTRVLRWISSLMVLVLLSMGLLVAVVSAQLAPSSQLQGLPTRPSATVPPPPQPSPEPPEPPSSPQPPSPPPEPGLLPTPTTVPSPAASPPAVSADTLPFSNVVLTFEELGYETFQLSESGVGSKLIQLYLPHNLVSNSARSYLELIISHAPPEPDKLAVIRLTLNNAPLAVIRLSPENAEPTTYRFYLEYAPLTAGRNRLGISLDSGAGCNVRGARVDVAVHESSLFYLEYSLSSHSPDLARYPIPFFEWSFKYEPVYVVLPQDPSVADMSAAATIAAGLGKFSQGNIRLVSILDTQVSAEIRDNHHLIVVGKMGTNRLLEQLELPLRLDDPMLADEQGVIQELVSPWNPLYMILVVTGRSEEGLSKASQALNRDVYLLGMQGTVAIVETVLPPEPVEGPRRQSDFALADLGYEEEVVHGTMPHVLHYRFYMPLGWAITEDPRFVLYFGHAKVLNPSSSSLDLYFNNVPMESVLLDESNASEGTLELPLPFWLIRSSRNEIQISIEMNLQDEDKCLFLDATHLWTAIYSHSYFHVPYVAQDVRPSLDVFPYPFDKRPSLSGVLLALPDQPRQLDYDLLLEVATGLGAADQGDSLVLDVTTAALITQEERRDRDLILIGRPSIHSLIAELNEQLPQPFEPGSDLLRPHLESVVFAQDPSRGIGLIEELAAPWDPERTVLVLTGTTDEGVGLASRTLFSRDDAVAGNMVLVEESIGVHAFDTRPPSSTSGDQIAKPNTDWSLLIQLGERWW